MVRCCEVREMRNAEAELVIIRVFSDVVTGKRLEIERLTGRLGEGRWKSTQMGNSLATYPTARRVRWGVWGNAHTLVWQRALHLPN
jgi:hypothetical protein